MAKTTKDINPTDFLKSPYFAKGVNLEASSLEELTVCGFSQQKKRHSYWTFLCLLFLV